jgi:excisionase family DNA binding protein
MPVDIGGVTLYTIREVANTLKINSQTVRKYIKTGELGARRVGRPYLISDNSLREFFLRTVKNRPDKEVSK